MQRQAPRCSRTDIVKAIFTPAVAASAAASSTYDKCTEVKAIAVSQDPSILQVFGRVSETGLVGYR